MMLSTNWVGFAYFFIKVFNDLRAKAIAYPFYRGP